MLVPVLMSLHVPKQTLCSSEHPDDTCPLHVSERSHKNTHLQGWRGGTWVNHHPDSFPALVPAQLCHPHYEMVSLSSYLRIALVPRRQAGSVMSHFPTYCVPSIPGDQSSREQGTEAYRHLPVVGQAPANSSGGEHKMAPGCLPLGGGSA